MEHVLRKSCSVIVTVACWKVSFSSKIMQETLENGKLPLEKVTWFTLTSAENYRSTYHRNLLHATKSLYYSACCHHYGDEFCPVFKIRPHAKSNHCFKIFKVALELLKALPSTPSIWYAKISVVLNYIRKREGAVTNSTNIFNFN